MIYFYQIPYSGSDSLNIIDYFNFSMYFFQSNSTFQDIEIENEIHNLRNGSINHNILMNQQKFHLDYLVEVMKLCPTILSLF